MDFDKRYFFVYRHIKLRVCLHLPRRWRQKALCYRIIRKRAVEINPSIDIIEDLVWSIQEFKDYSEKLKLCNQILPKKPNDLYAITQAAYVHRRYNHREEAKKLYSQAITISPKYPDARCGLGGIYYL